MRRSPSRNLTALVGISLLLLYALVAAVGHRFLVAAFEHRPDPFRLLAYFLVVTALVGYLSYRLGTAGLLGDLGAVEIEPVDAPGLYARLERIAPAFDVEGVTLYAARMDAPNALGVGAARGGAVVLDTGLFGLLSADELEAIVAHELAHLEGRDGLIQTIGYTAVRTVGGVCYLALLPVGLLVGGFLRALSWLRGKPPRPFLEHLGRVQWRVIQIVVVALFAMTVPLRAHSRRREYRADDRAVEATGKPIALARALVKIQRASRPGWGLLSPLYVHGDERGLLTKLLATHPPLDERIERLVRQARQAGRTDGRRTRTSRDRPPPR
jgi:heat shock protein HtpX